MPVLTDNYLDQVPEIYKDIMAAYPVIDPNRRIGMGLSIQTVHAAVHEKYSIGEVQAACTELEKNHFIELRHGVFMYPLELGEQMIAKLTHGPLAAPIVPPLPPPPAIEAELH